MGWEKPREAIQNDDFGNGEIKVAGQRPKESQKLSGTSDSAGCHAQTQTRANMGKKARVRFWNLKKVDTDREN